RYTQLFRATLAGLHRIFFVEVRQYPAGLKQLYTGIGVFQIRYLNPPVLLKERIALTTRLWPIGARLDPLNRWPDFRPVLLTQVVQGVREFKFAQFFTHQT